MDKEKIKSLTPKEIVSELDKYIIGQTDAKRSVAIALRNRFRRQQVEEEIREEIMPNNIILIGPTGTGKTEISRRLANLSNAPFIKVEATKYTEVGYVGRDVESMIRDLVEISIKEVRDEKSKLVEDKAIQRTYDRILDILLPPIKNNKESETDPVFEKHLRTKKKLREQLVNGELDNRQIEVNVNSKSANVQVLAPMGLDEISNNLQDMLNSVNPKKKELRKMKVPDAFKALKQEELQVLLDMEEIISEAIKRTETSGIVFIDEIDKVASSASKKSGADVSREGVQRDLLPIVEGTSVSTKHGAVKTDHILFIASGAFHVSKPSDLIPELQGRFPIRVELKALTEEDFVRILKEPKAALLKQYQALLAADNVKITFHDKSITEIARLAAFVNDKHENIGARRLHTILSKLMEDIMFDVPDIEKDSFVITEKIVAEKLTELVKDEDLSQYIL